MSLKTTFTFKRIAVPLFLFAILINFIGIKYALNEKLHKTIDYDSLGVLPQEIPTRKPCFVFLHIPKVGGRTVTNFLKSFIQAAGFEKAPGVYGEKFSNATELKFNNTFVFGHFSTALFRLNPSANECFRMTVLREPVDRAISAFFYHKHKMSELNKCLVHNDTENITESDIKNIVDQNSIQKAIRSDASDDPNRCKLKWQYSNDITRRLAGVNDAAWNVIFEGVFRAPAPTRKHLEYGKQNLEQNFDLVCFLHELSSCAEKLIRHFNLDGEKVEALDTTMMRTNKDTNSKTKTRPKELDNRTMEMFRSANDLDIDLYNWALSTYL